MTAKEFLQQAFILDRQIKSKKEQIQRLRDMQLSVSQVLQKDRVQTSHKLQKSGEYSDLILDLIDEYTKDVTRLLRLKNDIKKAIETLDNPAQRLILEERYINLKRWEDIAVDNNYSWKGVHIIHVKALTRIKEYIEVHYPNML